jgi:hypothetical protein
MRFQFLHEVTNRRLVNRDELEWHACTRAYALLTEDREMAGEWNAG